MASTRPFNDFIKVAATRCKKQVHSTGRGPDYPLRLSPSVDQDQTGSGVVFEELLVEWRPEQVLVRP